MKVLAVVPFEFEAILLMAYRRNLLIYQKMIPDKCSQTSKFAPKVEEKHLITAEAFPLKCSPSLPASLPPCYSTITYIKRRRDVK